MRENPDLLIRGKWTLRCGDRMIVVKKGQREKSTHVIMKALVWALYLPDHPEATIEVRIGDRYKPDVIALGDDGAPRFWGECGQVGRRKLQSIFRRYPETHFAVAKWDKSLSAYARLIEGVLKGSRRRAPVDLLLFAEDSVERFIDEEGQISLSFDDLLWKRFGGEG